MNNENEDFQKKLKWYESKYGPYYETRGIKNWKNLFRKPTLLEWSMFVILILMLLGAWAYNEDTKKCRHTLENLPREVCEACREFQTNSEAYEDRIQIPDFSNLSFVNETGQV